MGVRFLYSCDELVIIMHVYMFLAFKVMLESSWEVVG